MADSLQKLRSEADKVRQTVEQNVDTEKLKQRLDVSNFDVNAVIRGAQLTLVGGRLGTVALEFT
jgi:hypothetical protein